jgi:hypothetical protein
MSVIELIVVGEVDIACLCLQAVDFFVMGLKGSCKLVVCVWVVVSCWVVMVVCRSMVAASP